MFVRMLKEVELTECHYELESVFLEIKTISLIGLHSLESLKLVKTLRLLFVQAKELDKDPEKRFILIGIFVLFAVYSLIVLLNHLK